MPENNSSVFAPAATVGTSWRASDTEIVSAPGVATLIRRESSTSRTSGGFWKLAIMGSTSSERYFSRRNFVYRPTKLSASFPVGDLVFITPSKGKKPGAFQKE
jgi:hypothetical protein